MSNRETKEFVVEIFLERAKGLFQRIRELKKTYVPGMPNVVEERLYRELELIIKEYQENIEKFPFETKQQIYQEISDLSAEVKETP